MNRLTYKEIYEDYKNEEIVCYNIIPTPNVSHQDCLNKLGQLEDIEEELGIDLITLFKALKNGVWVVNQCFPLQFSKEVEMYKINCLRCGIKYYDGYCEQNYYLKFKDYGKTWALTKEELK